MIGIDNARKSEDLYSFHVRAGSDRTLQGGGTVEGMIVAPDLTRLWGGLTRFIAALRLNQEDGACSNPFNAKGTFPQSTNMQIFL